MKANFAKLNQVDENWQHNIWTNKPELFPEEIKNIKGVYLRSPDEFKEHNLYDKLQKALKNGNQIRSYYAEAADLLRLMAVQKFGGIYNDMDYEIYDANILYDYMKKFDFMAGRETPDIHSYYGNAFIAAKPNHPIMTEALRRVLRNHLLDPKDPTLPEYLKYPCREYDRIYFDGPPTVTMSYFSKNNIEGNVDVILPPWMIFNLNFARYKNEYCDYFKIDKDDFITNDKNLDKLMAEYITNDVFSMEPFIKYSKPQAIAGADLRIRVSEQNIYYSFKDRAKYPVIGADMFCGSWVGDGKSFKMNHYWQWPWKPKSKAK